MPRSRHTGAGPLRLGAALLATTLFAAPAATAQTTMTLPLFGDGVTGVNAIIDWGSPEANAVCPRAVTTEGLVSCTFPAEAGPGPFQVRISGTVPRFGNGEAGYQNADRITRVVRFGNVGLTSLAGAFNGAERLTQVAADFPETVTNIAYMFRGAVALDDPNIRNWGMRTRNVTNTTGTFQDALSFGQELDSWCMRGVTSPAAATNFRALTIDGSSLTQIRNRLGQLGSDLQASMKLTEEKEPRWGQCGVTIDGTPPPPVTAGAPFSLDLRSRTSLWANAPSGSSVNDLTFSVVSGTLPPGMSLNASTGLISGTPSAAGTYNFTIRAVQN